LGRQKESIDRDFVGKGKGQQGTPHGLSYKAIKNVPQRNNGKGKGGVGKFI